MRRPGTTDRVVTVVLFAVLLSLPGVASPGAEVTGVVRMPEVCSPAVSPAVVYLMAADRKASGASPTAAAASPRSGRSEIALVNQRGLQFTPRVQAIALGQ